MKISSSSVSSLCQTCENNPDQETEREGEREGDEKVQTTIRDPDS